jgi:predicted RNase H-like HicB family nuclease
VTQAKLEFMKDKHTAVIKQDSGWWIGWIEEIPGVNCQGKTKAELKKNFHSALTEALEFNRKDALKAAEANCEETVILA